MAKSFHDRLPLFVEIPIPIPDPRPRGIRSLGAMSRAFSVRIDAILLARLDTQADELGVTRGAYIRWCTEQMVKKIDEHINESKSTERKHNDTPDDDTGSRENQLALRFPDDDAIPATPSERDGYGDEGDN